MSMSAIIIMIVAFGVLWGGFIYALIRLPKEK